jgi:transposase
MLINKSYIKNYNEFNDNFQLILPLNLENLIPEYDSVRLLSHVLEGLDYKIQNERTQNHLHELKATA